MVLVLKVSFGPKFDKNKLAALFPGCTFGFSHDRETNTTSVHITGVTTSVDAEACAAHISATCRVDMPLHSGQSAFTGWQPKHYNQHGQQVCRPQPGQLGQPGHSAQPRQHRQPEQPEHSAQLEQYGQRGQPMQLRKSRQHGQPGHSAQLEQHGQHGQPMQHGQPRKPIHQGHHGQHGQPMHPGQQVQPMQPGQQVQPMHRGQHEHNVSTGGYRAHSCLFTIGSDT